MIQRWIRHLKTKLPYTIGLATNEGKFISYTRQYIIIIFNIIKTFSYVIEDSNRISYLLTLVYIRYKSRTKLI